MTTFCASNENQNSFSSDKTGYHLEENWKRRAAVLFLLGDISNAQLSRMDFENLGRNIISLTP